METLAETIAGISNALLVPVAVGLLALLAWVLVACGGFARELVERRRAARSGGEPSADGAASGLVAAFDEAGPPERVEDAWKHLDALEVDAAARLAALAFGSRAGPILGLMGTLIPLGPALVGLSAGELEELSRGLVLAFGTTVVGLAAGILCQGMHHVRRIWYARDLGALEHRCRTLEREAGR